MLATAAVYAQTATPSTPDAPQTRVMIPMADKPMARSEVIANTREKFAALDKNGDGFLTRDELPQLPAGLQASVPPEANTGAAPGRNGASDRLFALMDKDKNGQISRAEFDAFYGKGGRHTVTVTSDGDKDVRQEHIVVAGDGGAAPAMPSIPTVINAPGIMYTFRFDRIDTNHDGKISAAEAEAAAVARFDRLDTNHDGMLSAEELSADMPRVVTRQIRAADPAAPLPPLDR